MQLDGFSDLGVFVCALPVLPRQNTVFALSHGHCDRLDLVTGEVPRFFPDQTEPERTIFGGLLVGQQVD